MYSTEDKNPHPLRWLGWFTGGNILLLVLIAQQYLLHGSHPENLAATIYWMLQSIGHFSFLAFLLYLPLCLLALILPFKSLITPLSVLAFSLLVILIQIDIQVFALYRFHLNAVVWEFLTTEGAAKETFVFDPVNFIMIGMLVIIVLVVQGALAWIIHKRLYRTPSFSGLSIVGGLLLVMLIGQSWHLIADARSQPQILRMVSLIPWPQGFTAKRFLRKYDLATVEAGTPTLAKSQLNYPKSEMQCSGPDQPYNIVFILIDSWRFDMLNESVTPNLAALKTESLVFNHHISSGNSTRFGVFGMFTGLLGNYWKTALRNNIGSVLIDEFVTWQYEIGIFRNARLTSPEFDRTIFTSIRESLPAFTPGDTVVEREIEIVRQFQRFLQEKKKKKFMSLVFFDAPHAYAFPAHMHLPFKPSLKQINYLALNNNSDPLPFLNRYKNSIYFDDMLSETVLSELKKQGVYDNTVIIVTGDHGQEFNETGQNYWGHNGNFSRYQVQVPLLIKWPGKQPREYHHTSSHLDLVPTLMTEYFKCSNDIQDYSNGQSLFDERERDFIISSSWSRYAAIQPEQTTVYNEIGGIDRYDRNYQPFTPPVGSKQISLQVLEELSRFYQP